MNETPAESLPRGSRALTASAAAIVIVFLVFFAYANSLTGDFLYDDQENILANPSVRGPFSLSHAFFAPRGVGTAGRPLANFLFALCWAASGGKTISFHLLSVLVHAASALALFGIIRRSLLLPSTKSFAAEQDIIPFALLGTLLWALHPMQTVCVAYISQVCESLMGLFFLLTLFLALRGWTSRRPWPWHLAAVCAMLLGTGVKEVIVTAPIMVLLFDLIFIRPGSLKAALSRSRLLYAGLFLCWIPLLLLVAGGGTASAGAVTSSVGTFAYARTQPQVILHYLRLTFFPAGLSFDYWWPPLSPLRALPYAAALFCLAGLSAWGLFKRRPAGFLGAWFFVVLAPTSSILAMGNLAFEHRMYLSLAAPVLLAAGAGYTLSRRGGRRALTSLGAAGAALVLVFTFLTAARNNDYASSYAIWKDTAEKEPENPRAFDNLGRELLDRGRMREARGAFVRAVSLAPAMFFAWNDLGRLELGEGNPAAAIKYFEAALKIAPTYADAHANLGTALSRSGKLDAAIGHFEAALRLRPGQWSIHNAYGVALAGGGRMAAARDQFAAAVRFAPNAVPALSNLGRALMETGDPAAALLFLERALSLDPQNERTRESLGEARARLR